MPVFGTPARLAADPSTPTSAATQRYTDLLARVSDVEPAAAPERPGLLWAVMPPVLPPPPPLHVVAVATSGTENTITWEEPDASI